MRQWQVRALRGWASLTPAVHAPSRSSNPRRPGDSRFPSHPTVGTVPITQQPDIPLPSALRVLNRAQRATPPSVGGTFESDSHHGDRLEDKAWASGKPAVLADPSPEGLARI